MPKNLKCIECSSLNETLYDDVRTPPIDIYPCFCTVCASAAIDERMEELQEELSNLTILQKTLDD